MNKPTHIMGGLVFGIGLGGLSGMGTSLSSLPLLVAVSGGAAIGALIPDIDKKNTAISHKAPVVSFFIRLLTTHRGFTHSLLALAILSGLLYYPVQRLDNKLVEAAYIGLIAGYLSHLVLDMLNPDGIPLLFPIKFKISFAKIRTGGKMEHIFRGILFALVIALIISFFKEPVTELVTRIRYMLPL